MTSYYPPSSYKAPVRQEGFHLPSPAPSNGNPPSPPHNFDINNQLYMPQLLSDPFRKYGGDGTATTSMDFSDELASLIAHSPAPHTNHQSSYERSTQSPVSTGSANGYDDNSYQPPTTHNIFDISASTQQQHQPNHNGYQNQFSQSLPQQQHQGSYHPLQEFHPHSHFNSTVPALNSTMRYDPQPPASHEPPFAPQFPSDYSQGRHSPSPVGFASASRSRSRSRAPNTPALVSEPPSTNGGPARTMRPKRNSMSSTSPPPHHRTQSIVIPAHRAPSQHTPISATSALSLHSLSSSTTSGWFVPSQQQHEFRHNEFSLPTPDSVGNHHGFSQFNPGPVTNGGNLGVSPKDVTVGKGTPAAESEEEAGSKQSVAMLAVEKRRRRRESHNAVERRRRDNINERIAELATLIPEVMLDPHVPVTPRSGDDFLFGITGIIGLSNPLGIEGLISMKKDDEDKYDDEVSVSKKSGGTNGTHTEGGVVKANKGMILRKSVEYIKYLQQLVSAQGSRNRDLEQELSAYRQGRSREPKRANGHSRARSQQRSSSRAYSETEDMNGLVLHEEVGEGQFVMNGLNGYPKPSFRGLELESMPEEDQNMHENLDDRPSTSGMDSLTSSSTGSGSFDGEDDRSNPPGAELNRGRDRTVRGQPDGAIKVKSEVEDMET